MYYQTQLRNLQKQAELQRKLAQVTIAQDLLSSPKRQSREKSNGKKKGLTKSRKQQIQQNLARLKRSRIEAQLEASNVSTNAILNRSRIESALEVRKRNNQLYTEREKSLIQEQYYQAAKLAAQDEILLERSRQIQLNAIRDINYRDELYRRIIHEEQERIQYERKYAESRSMLYDEEAKRRELLARQNEGQPQLTKPYYYY